MGFFCFLGGGLLLFKGIMNPHVELFLNYSKVADPDTVCCMKRQLQIYKNLPLGKKGPKT